MKLVKGFIIVAIAFLQPFLAEITVNVKGTDILSGSVYVIEDCSDRQSIESFISMVRSKTQEEVPNMLMRAYSSKVTTSIENDKSTGQCLAEFHYIPQEQTSGEQTGSTMGEKEMRSALENAFQIQGQ